ncbi:LuxR C-terminal-related transcriptional regulator [Streptomyces thinghirensis]|nr:LuxR C-terminal-related transcriptional regulator [Streptomyces thinghirensis]
MTSLSSLHGLTARERQILLRLAACEGNRVIARHLRITERTVKAHLTSILTKLSLTSRTEATVVAPPLSPSIVSGRSRGVPWTKVQ